MKNRNGFVSNSSSSSFIIVGATLTKKLETELIEKYNISKEDVENGIAEALEDASGLDVVYTKDSKKNCYTIGTVLADGEYLEDGSVTANDLMENIKNIQNKIGNHADVKLSFGTRPN